MAKNVYSKKPADNLKDMEVSTAKKRWKKKIPLTNTIQSAVADSKKDKYKTNEADETAIHLNKWVMPTPQLQAYIKCPRYDFL
jgi:hypothetical protein